MYSFHSCLKTQGYFFNLVSPIQKGKLVIVFLADRIMFVNTLLLCVAAIQGQSAAQEAKDKGLAGQILCKASSKIAFRTTAE